MVEHEPDYVNIKDLSGERALVECDKIDPNMFLSLMPKYFSNSYPSLFIDTIRNFNSLLDNYLKNNQDEESKSFKEDINLGKVLYLRYAPIKGSEYKSVKIDKKEDVSTAIGNKIQEAKDKNEELRKICISSLTDFYNIPPVKDKFSTDHLYKLHLNKIANRCEEDDVDLLVFVDKQEQENLNIPRVDKNFNRIYSLDERILGNYYKSKVLTTDEFLKYHNSQ